MNLFSISKSKTPAQVLRDVDVEYPDAKAVIVIVMNKEGSVGIRCSKINTAEASWMSRALEHQLIRWMSGR